MALACLIGGTASGASGLSRIAVQSTQDFKDIFVVAANGAETRRIRFPSPVIGRVDLTDDGKYLGASTGDGVYVVSTANGSARRVKNMPTAARSGAVDVTWAPGGGQFAFTLAQNLWTIFANGNAPQRLANGAQTPDWSPDGTQLAFVRGLSLATGLGRIYAIGTDGRDLHFITRGAQPAYSPDGAKLAYLGRGGIFVTAADGGPTRLVIPNGSHPEWSPDGRRIAFTRKVGCSEAGCSGRIFIAPAAGGRARPIGPAVFDIGALSWSR